MAFVLLSGCIKQPENESQPLIDVQYVLVNGRLAIAAGELTSVLAGRPVTTNRRVESQCT